MIGCDYTAETFMDYGQRGSYPLGQKTRLFVQVPWCGRLRWLEQVTPTRVRGTDCESGVQSRLTPFDTN